MVYQYLSYHIKLLHGTMEVFKYPAVLTFIIVIQMFHCGILSRIFFVMPVCVRNAHHLFQLPDCLIAVSLVIHSIV